MKMTIVIDTDDINGIEDAYKMTPSSCIQSMLALAAGYSNVSFGKIEFIKMLRKFGREAVENYKTDEDFELESNIVVKVYKVFF